MRTDPDTQPIPLLEYIRLRDAWNYDSPLQQHDFAVLLGVSRSTIERRLLGVRAHNAPPKRLRPRRGATFLPSVVAPYLFNGQPYRRLGPAIGEPGATLAQEAS